MMKTMDQNAPMISVPAGVFREFMAPTNSRTPTPPVSNIPVTNGEVEQNSEPISPKSSQATEEEEEKMGKTEAGVAPSPEDSQVSLNGVKRPNDDDSNSSSKKLKVFEKDSEEVDKENKETDPVQEMNKVDSPKSLKEVRIFPETTKEESIDIDEESIESTSSSLPVTPAFQKESRRKLQKLTRKQLEDMVYKLFIEKSLYQANLGKTKQVIERLEVSCETNRKKAVQFHKEVEDLKKVTSRLKQEHISRKGQFVAPIRIKRSVGIQAAPHIITKGMSSANGPAANNGNAVKTIVARPSAVVGVSGSQNTMRANSMPGGVVRKPIPPAPNVVFNTQMMPVGKSHALPRVLAPSQAVGVNASPAIQTQAGLGTMRPSGGQMLMVAPPGVMQTIPRQTQAGIRPGQRPMGAAQGTLVKVPATNTTQLLAINPNQVVLLPQSSGQAATALVATGVTSLQSKGSPAVAQARMGAVVGSSASRGSVMHATATTTSTSMRHPAPLPRTPYQQIGGITKNLPPQPDLKLSHKDNSIVLSWDMKNKTEDHEAIASYQLYAYQEGTLPPSPQLWKKVGSVKALELPMACTLTQFMPGHVYHFAVRAVDIKSRSGPFSEPQSIRLNK